MQISCPACAKRLQIADDKLPADRQVRLTCPACQERFTFDPQANQPTVSPADSAPTSEAVVPTAHHPSTAAVPFRIDISEAGTAPRALICLDDISHRETYQKALPSLGYNTVHMMSDQDEAQAYLSQVPYACFVLDATFAGSSLEDNPVLTCLRQLPMEQRRSMFVTLCAPDMETADAMSAYSRSVNLVLNHTDVPSCHHLLEQHLAEHERLYRVYRELRQQMGKDI